MLLRLQVAKGGVAIAAGGSKTAALKSMKLGKKSGSLMKGGLSKAQRAAKSAAKGGGGGGGGGGGKAAAGDGGDPGAQGKMAVVKSDWSPAMATEAGATEIPAGCIEINAGSVVRLLAQPPAAEEAAPPGYCWVRTQPPDAATGLVSVEAIMRTDAGGKGNWG
eukprot:SAG22_NODE_781_length_7267_cov_28.189035_2_plen_163_part_00